MMLKNLTNLFGEKLFFHNIQDKYSTCVGGRSQEKGIAELILYVPRKRDSQKEEDRIITSKVKV